MAIDLLCFFSIKSQCQIEFLKKRELNKSASAEEVPSHIELPSLIYTVRFKNLIWSIENRSGLYDRNTN